MNSTLNIGNLFSGIFAVVLLVIGVLNVILVHPIPGVMYILLSFVYTPTANALLRKKFGISIPAVAKIFVAVASILFTLGVSDLGDMVDKM